MGTFGRTNRIRLESVEESSRYADRICRYGATVACGTCSRTFSDTRASWGRSALDDRRGGRCRLEGIVDHVYLDDDAQICVFFGTAAELGTACHPDQRIHINWRKAQFSQVRPPLGTPLFLFKYFNSSILEE